MVIRYAAMKSRCILVLLAGLVSGACAHQIAAPGAPSRGRVVLVAGGPDDGSRVALHGAGMNEPFAVALDRAGNLYITEERGNRVQRVDPRGAIAVYAGTGVKGFSGEGGPATSAMLSNPHHVTFAPGNLDDLIIADTMNARVRRVDHTTGIITTIAGSEKGFGGDGGPATQAKFSMAFCLAFDPSGEKMYIADTGNRRIRSVNLRTGLTATEAGNGEKGIPADGAEALKAPLLDPRAVAADAAGNIYILERNGHVLRVVDKAGKIRTVAGTGQPGNWGDGGPALQAAMNGPKHLTVDHAGDVLIADTENHLVRKYLAREGRMVRVAGTGTKGAGVLGGSPDQVGLDRPHGVFVDAKGDIYISDSSNHRVLKLEY
jgi:DNA-binding beta-propeller fold protein YncE